MNIQEFRKQYPMYDKFSDQVVAEKLHEKYYSGMPKEDFYNRFGIKYTGPETLGWGGVKRDIKEGFKAVPGAIARGLEGAPQEIGGAAMQLFDPMRLQQNLLGGLGQGLHGLGNTPANISDYLAQKEIIPRESEGKFPRFEERNFPEILGRRGSEAGDALLSGITSYLPYLIGGEAAIPRAAGMLGKMVPRAVAGGLHAIGQNENPITGATMGAIPIGAAVQGGKNIYRAGKLAMKANPPAKFAASVLEGVENRALTNKKGFKNLFSQVEKEISHVDAPKNINLKALKKVETDKGLEPISAFIAENTPSKAHFAQSELGRIERELISKKKSPGGLSGYEKKALEAAQDAKSAITDSLYKSFEKHGNKEFIKKYSELRNIHKTKIRPAERNPLLRQYAEGDISLEDLGKALPENRKFRARFSEEHPEMKYAGLNESFKKGISNVSGFASALKIMKALSFI